MQRVGNKEKLLRHTLKIFFDSAVKRNAFL